MNSEGTNDKPPRVIKRYPNRKLYDTERSCYITLEEITQMIRAGVDVRVIDNKTKEDLTAVTFAQIILEEERKVAKMPLKLLRSIIQSGNDAIGDFVQKRVTDPVQHLRGDVERRVESLFSRKGKVAGDEEGTIVDADATESGGDVAQEAVAEANQNNLIQEWVQSTSETFELWQRRIDERVRDAVSRMGGLRVQVDTNEIEEKISRLEQRLEGLESHNKDKA